jgi:HD superfamily phosphodiesterase
MLKRIHCGLCAVALAGGLTAAGAVGAAKPATKPAVSAGSEADWRGTVRDYAKANFRNPAWGYSHSVRNYDLARQLAAADRVQLDDDVLFATAFLHDMAAFPAWARQGIDHADSAADEVNKLLDGTGFPAKKIDAVRGAIRTDMFDPTPVATEALYLHDADALDWLGAVGVARVMALVSNGAAPDGPAMVKMLDTNLAKVPNRVLSPAGKQLVAGRTAELKAFLRRLRAETADLAAL